MGVSIPNSALETSSLIKYITFLTIRDLGIVSGMSMKQQINCIRANRYVSIERYVTVHLAPAIVLYTLSMLVWCTLISNDGQRID